MIKFNRLMLTLGIIILCGSSYAGSPVWLFEPLTATRISVPPSGSAVVQYLITNLSQKPHTLMMKPIEAVVQISAGPGVCPNPFTLTSRASCVLSLSILGSALMSDIIGGPVVCEAGSMMQCYGPSNANSLYVTRAPII